MEQREEKKEERIKYRKACSLIQTKLLQLGCVCVCDYIIKITKYYNFKKDSGYISLKTSKIIKQTNSFIRQHCPGNIHMVLATA